MSDWRMECSCSNPEGLVSVGDTVVFSVMVFRNDSPDWDGDVEWRLFSGPDRNETGGTLRLAPGCCTVRVKAAAPGGYRCRFSRTMENGTVLEKSIGVLAGAETLRPKWKVPDDFDAFWSRMSARLNVKSGRYLRTDAVLFDGRRTFRAEAVGGADVTMRGELQLPDGANNGSLPGVITFHGAGVRSTGFARCATWAARGFLSLEVAAHGLPVWLKPEYYASEFREHLYQYHRRGLTGDDPARCYFTEMFLRAALAVEFMARQPEWDGKNLFVTGGSQGGWQSLAAAMLDRRISAAGVWIPAGCDIARGTWPCCGPLAEERALENEYRAVLPYIDSASFLSRITAPLAIFAGLADSVCHAGSVAAAYNMAAGKNRIIHWYSQTGHEDNPVLIDGAEAFLIHNLR